MCSFPAEWHWLTTLFLGSLDVFNLGLNLNGVQCWQILQGMLQPCHHLITLSSGILSLFLEFQSLIIRGVQEKFWHTVHFCISNTGLDYGAQPWAGCSPLLVLLLQLSVSSTSACGQARGWIDKNILKVSNDRWWVLPLVVMNAFQSHRLKAACSGGNSRKDSGLQVGRSRGIFLLGESGGPVIAQPGEGID